MEIPTLEEIKNLAAQLRKPEGTNGIEVANMMNIGNQAMNLQTLAVLNPAAGDNILEIGMGNGFFVRNILNLHSTIKYTGCDYSELMIEAASKINATFIADKRADFILSDAISLPLQDSTFSKIFTINTFYFWSNIEKTLAEFKRVLKPNGEIIIAVRPKEIMLKMPVTQHGFNLYTNEEIEKYIIDAGFKNIQITRIIEPSQERMGQVVSLETIIFKASY